MTPHVKWWTTAKHETHGEFCLDDFEANHFYGEPPYHLTGPHAHKVKYLCGYVDIGGGAASESPTIARCPMCLILAPQAKIEHVVNFDPVTLTSPQPSQPSLPRRLYAYIQLLGHTLYHVFDGWRTK